MYKLQSCAFAESVDSEHREKGQGALAKRVDKAAQMQQLNNTHGLCVQDKAISASQKSASSALSCREP